MKRKKRKIELDVHEIENFNMDVLRRFVAGDGKSARIISRYVTGLTTRDQKKVTRAVKRARQLNLL